MFSKKKSKSGRFFKNASKALCLIQKILAKVQALLFNNYEMKYINLFYKKFYRDNNYYSFSKSITEYNIKHPEKVQELKKNLDQQSILLIDTLLARYNYIYTHNVLELDKILTIKELKAHSDIIKFYQASKITNIFKIDRFDNAVFYYKHGLIYLPKEILSDLKEKDIIDGGAYNGDSALMFEKELEVNKIYSFEPISNNYNRLLETIELNHLKKVVPVKAGLGIENGIIKIEDSGSASSLLKQGDEEINVITLDDYVSKNNFNIGIIKLDIEGYGLQAIKGAKNTIKQHKPILLISIYHSGEEFFEVKNYIHNLNLNYKFVIRKLGVIKPFYDTNLLAWVE